MVEGLLIITHERIGRSLLEVAEKILPNPIPTQILEIKPDQDTHQALQQARQFVQTFSKSHRVLVLTDLYGATPSNLAWQTANEYHLTLLTGLNLPMLLTVFNYPDLAINELSRKLVKAGREGIVEKTVIK